MVSINLLPWREQKRIYQIKVMKKMLMFTVLMVLCIFSVTHFMLSQHENKVRDQIAVIAAKIKRNQLQQEKSIKQVQPTLNKMDQAALISKIFYEISNKQPEKVCFTNIERQNNIFSFTGKARSMTELTDFFRHWNAAYLFAEIKIKLIEKQEDGWLRFGFQASENKEQKEV